jgi:hypothetical protein
MLTRMHTAGPSTDAAPHELHNPFIVASPSVSPTHTAAAVTAATTTIHMDSADDLESHTASSCASELTAGCVGAVEQQQVGSSYMSSDTASKKFPDESRPSLSTYQLASAALRRLPARPAPSASAAVPSTNRRGITGAPANLESSNGKTVNGETRTAGVSAPPSRFRELQPPPPLRSFAQSMDDQPSSPPPPPPPHASSSSPVSGRGAASPGRFQVPPLPPQESATSFPPAAAPAPSAPHQHAPQQQQHQQGASSPSLSARHSGDAARSGTSLSHSSGRSGEDGGAEEDEEDVAARVLSSLKQKDTLIQRLTRAVSALEQENASLRQRGRATRTAAAADGVSATLTPPRATAQARLLESVDAATTPEAQRVLRRSPARADDWPPLTRSPSLPTTPMRWWKEKPFASVQGEPTSTTDELQTSGHDSTFPRKEGGGATVGSPSHSLAAAHAAVDTVVALQAALAEKDAALAEVTAELARLHASEGPAPSPRVPSAVGEDVSASAAVLEKPMDASAHPNPANTAAPSVLTAALEAAQARIASLEYQLDTMQEEKREDQRTMREHIDHLTRELHGKTKESRRQERQHKLELEGLQREVTALADQLDEQLRAATAVSASVDATARDVLQRQLAEARVREERLLHESAAAQHQWTQELEEQKRLVDIARKAAARAAEGQTHSRTQEDEEELRQLRQQQQQAEAEAQQWRLRAEQAQHDLAELRAVHQHTEEVVAVQRAELQELTEALATATLQHIHDEQRAAQVERQLEVHRQQLRHLEAELTSKDTEVEQLRQERSEEVDRLLREQDSEHHKLLKQVEGCMKGSEAVEGALLEAEARRREVAAQLTRVVIERDELHCRLRDSSVQARTQLLEQHQLFQEGQTALQQRLVETQQQLEDCSGALKATQQELRVLRDKLPLLEAAQAAASEEQERQDAKLQEAELTNAQLTTRLVETKEALKDALQAQLSTTNSLSKAERQARALRDGARRAEERRAEEQIALRRVVELLMGGEGQPTPSVMTAVIRGSHKTLTESARARGGRDAHLTLPEEEVVEDDEDDDGAATTPRSPPSVASQGSSATAESVTMSAVDGAPELITDSTIPASSAQGGAVGAGRGDGVDGSGRRHDTRAPHSLPPPLNASLQEETSLKPARQQHHTALSRTADNTILPSATTTLKCISRSTLHDPSLLLLSSREGKEELCVVRTLASIHDAVQQLLRAHSAAIDELCTKRTAVRTLVAERKAQSAALAKAQRALQEQQSDAERQRRDLAKALRAEAKSALEDLKRELDERHAAALAQSLAAERQRCEEQQQQQSECCAHRVCAQLIGFVKELPTTVYTSISALALPAVVAPTAGETKMLEQDQRVPRASQTSATGCGIPYHDYRGYPCHASYTPLQQPPYATAATAATAVVPSRYSPPGVEAECDLIAREVLGIAGGWADLSRAAAADDAVPPFPPQPPAYVGIMRRGDAAVEYDTTVDAPHTSELPETRWTATVALRKSAVWEAKEVAELQEVMDAYLRRCCTSRIVDGGASVAPQRGKGRDAEVDTDKEEEEEPLVAMGLRWWMESLRKSDSAAAPAATTTTPRKPGNRLQKTQTSTAAATSLPEAEPLALLLNACVAHAMECALRGGVVHVAE